MKRINTHKAHTAMNLAASLSQNGRIAAPATRQDVEALYAWLYDHDYIWDTDNQMWRKRLQGTRRAAKTPTITANSVLLIRVMGMRDTLAKEMENFTLAMEVAGYEITSVSGPLANRGQNFYRVYLKVKVG